MDNPPKSQGAEGLLEYGIIKKKLPLDEHVAREFTPVRV
jgi:hypothetical protein